MSTYRDLGHRLLLEAAQGDPAKAERLKMRALEYLLLADEIDGPEPTVANEQISPVVHQQQQPQPQGDDQRSSAPLNQTGRLLCVARPSARSAR
jgi:hypothetical protein